MKLTEGAKADLHSKFLKVIETPAGFDFYIAIHDLIECIESNPSFLKIVIRENKTKGANLPKRYAHLKQIHQSVKDIDIQSNDDLGHDRYAGIRDIKLIRDKDVSESNSFWKKRELFRKLTREMHKMLDADSASKSKK